MMIPAQHAFEGATRFGVHQAHFPTIGKMLVSFPSALFAGEFLGGLNQGVGLFGGARLALHQC